jgi:hypothetical protein
MRHVRFVRVKTKQATMQGKQGAYNIIVRKPEEKNYNGLLLKD